MASLANCIGKGAYGTLALFTCVSKQIHSQTTVKWLQATLAAKSAAAKAQREKNSNEKYSGNSALTKAQRQENRTVANPAAKAQ